MARVPDHNDPNDLLGQAGFERQVGELAQLISLGSFVWIMPIAIIAIVAGFSLLMAFFETGDFFLLIMGLICLAPFYFAFKDERFA